MQQLRGTDARLTGPLSLGRGLDVIQHKARSNKAPKSDEKIYMQISTEWFWLRNLAIRLKP
jgi:hypothetical protein